MLITSPIPTAKLASMLEDFRSRHALESSLSLDSGLIAECIARLRGLPSNEIAAADRPRVYIAGPMTGLPQHNYPAFYAAAEKLRDMGWHVENPAENPEPPCKSWSGYMRLAVAQLATCGYVALLPGWESSKGAGIEHRLAHDLALQVLPIDRFGAP